MRASPNYMRAEVQRSTSPGRRSDTMLRDSQSHDLTKALVEISSSQPVYTEFGSNQILKEVDADKFMNNLADLRPKDFVFTKRRNNEKS